ncbi:MAG: hypothetical protein IKE21_09670 [Erysipelotrichaceae bacterium]|nr:hypothetical protein [Erysipelotrichaceae bacterium]
MKEFSNKVSQATYFRLEKGQAGDQFFYRLAEYYGIKLAKPGFLSRSLEIASSLQRLCKDIIAYDTEMIASDIKEIETEYIELHEYTPFLELIDTLHVLLKYYVEDAPVTSETIQKIMKCISLGPECALYYPLIEIAGMSAWSNAEMDDVEMCKPFMNDLPYWLKDLESFYARLYRSQWSAIEMLENNIDQVSDNKVRYFLYVKRLYTIFSSIDNRKAKTYRDQLLELLDDNTIPEARRRGAEYSVLVRCLLEKDYDFALQFGRNRLEIFNPKCLLVYTMIQSLSHHELNDRILKIEQTEGYYSKMLHFYVMKKRGEQALKLEKYLLGEIEPLLKRDNYHPPFTGVMLEELSQLVLQTKHYRGYYELSQNMIQNN